MGMRSSVNGCSLTADIGKLKRWKQASKLVGQFDQYLYDSLILDNVQEFEDDTDIYLDWDDWKIQGYWYDDFCNFITTLAELGVEGEVSLTYETDADYTIKFKDKKIIVDFYKDPEFDDDGNILPGQDLETVEETLELYKIGHNQKGGVFFTEYGFREVTK